MSPARGSLFEDDYVVLLSPLLVMSGQPGEAGKHKKIILTIKGL